VGRSFRLGPQKDYLERNIIIMEQNDLSKTNQHVLDDVYDWLGRFVVYPSVNARIAHTLWIAHTHLIDAFDYSPRLMVLSAEKRSGKSTLVKLTKVLAQNGYSFVNPSPASIYSIIDAKKPLLPTLCIDEQDRLWEKKETGQIISILDQGFERDNDGVPRVRLDKDGKRHTDMFNTFCPVLLAGIDNDRIPDTITDRGITIRMQRRSSDEPVEPYRIRHKPEGVALRKRLEDWAKEQVELAKKLIPERLATLDDRNADLWEPLFIVADVTNVTNVTTWRTQAREAALWSAEQRSDDAPSNNVLVLMNIRDAFENEDRIFKSKVEDKIALGRNEFNRLLRKFNVPKDHAIRIGSENQKGWYKSEWGVVFKRYEIDTPVTPVTMVTTDTMVTNETERSVPVPCSSRDTPTPVTEHKPASFDYHEWMNNRKKIPASW
jgi:hypothetical protein